VLATPLTAATMVLVKMLYVEDVLGEAAHVDGINPGEEKNAGHQSA